MTKNFSSRKVLYWVFTGIMCLIFLYSAWMYLSQYEMVKGFYTHLGFPHWMIYPLAIFKILGVTAVLLDRVKVLKEWAYAGFAFDALAALTAHYLADEGIASMAGIALIATLGSRFLWQNKSQS